MALEFLLYNLCVGGCGLVSVRYYVYKVDKVKGLMLKTGGVPGFKVFET